VVGPPASKILLVGSRPEGEDVSKGMPFGGKKGDVLFGEFSRVGLPLQRMRIMYLFDHQGSTEECDKISFVNVLKEMKDKDGVLLIGAEACEGLRIGSVSKLIGLTVSSIYFPSSVGFVMATSNPPTSDYVGEFRLSVEKFAKKLKEAQGGEATLQIS